MDKYIDREAFLAAKRKVYCEDCDSRKNSKGKMVYDIGDAPCRACRVGDMLDDVDAFPAADVVTRDCYDRILWENDIMRQQLADIGKAFAETMDDVRPVVLCRDCKHYRLDPIEVGQMVCAKDADEVNGYFSGFLSYPSEDWFCADGVKREES